MKRLFGFSLLACLALASCAPSASGVPPIIDTDSARSSLMQQAGISFYTFFSGDLPAYDLRLTITGNDLRVNAPEWCKADTSAMRCTVPLLPAGKNFVLPMRGSDLSVVALYKRSQTGADFTRRAR